jgi:16S rRNA (guanine966-N2)-methyltransferase
MTRIVAGQWGGRRLDVPPGDGTRPTSDRVREAMFASLHSALGGFDKVRVLDLFAGSGALGLEALSRGAEHADLVELSAKAAQVAQRNVAELAAPAVVHRMSAERFLASAPAKPYHLLMLDPPYAMATEDLRQLVARLEVGSWRDEHSVIVVERSIKDPWAWPDTVTAIRDKRYGQTQLWYGR